jgi:hypothetical protein
MLVDLRKKGFNYHPYSGKIRVGVSRKTGIVVDIMEKEEWLTSGLNNYEDHSSLPHLEGMLRKIETGIMKFPQLAPQIQGVADRIMLASIESRKRLRSEQRLLLKEAETK